jgi:septal ring factor EnvC (AmiA/AmiB activator)
MPAPIYIQLNRSLRIEIINGEMDQLNQQLNSVKENVRELRNTLRSRQDEIDSIERQLINLYIQNTGGLPEP